MEGRDLFVRYYPDMSLDGLSKQEGSNINKNYFLVRAMTSVVRLVLTIELFASNRYVGHRDI
jgi:hypothetical protein